MYIIKIVSTAVVASVFGFLIHLFYGQGIAAEYVQFAASDGRLADVVTAPPAGEWMFYIAVLTAVIPMIGKLFLYLMLQEKLPGKNKIVKGALFGCLLLFVTDWFVRIPIMMVVGGNPVDVVLVQSLERWIIYPATGILIALFVPEDIWQRKVEIGM